jgi:calcineurin-like phosphoesterase family protein
MPDPTRRRRLGIGLSILAMVVVLALVAALGATTATPGPKKTKPPGPTPTAQVTAGPTSGLPPSPSINPPSGPPPSSGAAVTLVGAGDIGDCSSGGDEATAALLDTIAGTVFTLGDNAYENGTSSEFTSCYGPNWGRAPIKSRTKPLPGNHDYNTSGATGYYGYYGAAAGDPAKGYYAYDAGAWRVYVLNSNCSAIGGCGAGSAQEQWLRGDLAANPRACALGMWHHPRFSSGEHGSSTATQALYQALYDANAELALVGHDHDYERFGPQTATGVTDNGRGIVQIVAGTSGRGLYDFGTIRANSLVRNNDTWGVLRLSLSPGSWSFDFVPVAGRTFTDSGSGSCH